MEDTKSKKKHFGSFCCVVDCHKSTGGREKETIKFFKVLRANEEQSKLWVKAINRENPDGSEWKPSKSTLICSEHFVSGTYSNDKDHPDFVPTKFPSGSGNAKPAKEADVNRYQRVNKVYKTILHCQSEMGLIISQWRSIVFGDLTKSKATKV